MNFYESYYNMYMNGDPTTRVKSKAYWIRRHKENLTSGRQDLIIFSGQILAMISLAEDKLTASDTMD